MLSFAAIMMQTILEPNFLKKYLADVVFFSYQKNMYWNLKIAYFYINSKS